MRKDKGRTGEPAKGQQGVGRSFQHAYDGIAAALRTQRNLKIHLAVAVVVLVAAPLLGASRLELAVLVLVIVVVFVAEMLNTALEFAVDLVTREHRPLAKLAKDVSAGAVLVSSVGAVVVGYLILADRLFAVFSGGLESARSLPAQYAAVSLVLAAAVALAPRALGDPAGRFAGAWPSGHAAAAFAAWISASYLSADAVARHAGTISSVTLLMALLVCQSRVEAGASTLYGAASGALAGSLVAVALFQLL